jgi:hypothetical protein
MPGIIMGVNGAEPSPVDTAVEVVLTGATPYQQPVLKFSRQTACEGSGLIYLMSNTSLPFSL